MKRRKWTSSGVIHLLDTAKTFTAIKALENPRPPCDSLSIAFRQQIATSARLPQCTIWSWMLKEGCASNSSQIRMISNLFIVLYCNYFYFAIGRLGRWYGGQVALQCWGRGNPVNPTKQQIINQNNQQITAPQQYSCFWKYKILKNNPIRLTAAPPAFCVRQSLLKPSMALNERKVHA